MKTTYEVYCEWALAHGHAICDRDQFYLAMQTLPFAERSGAKQSKDDLEIEKESREGWGYGDWR
jgi:hypothetical protein